MPTSHHLPRRDSWPPTIIPLSLSNTTPTYAPSTRYAPSPTLTDIDENPISYFLSSPDAYDDTLDLAAGIECATLPPHPEIREVSPSSLMGLQNKNLHTEEGRRLKRERAREREEWRLLEEESASSWLGIAAPLSLREFSDRQSRKRRVAGQQGSASAVQRGRGVVRLTPASRGIGRGRSRSLSGPRRHSWREPSPEIVSIPEEGEGSGDGDGDDVEMGGCGREETPELLSDYGSERGEVEGVGEKKRGGKGKKRVRWAMPEGRVIGD